MTNQLRIESIVSHPFMQNTFILWREGRTDAVVIDPGIDVDAIERSLKRLGLAVAAILNTHGHADHIAGNAAMKQLAPTAPLIIGELDAPMLTDAELNLSAGFGFAFTSPPADQLVREGDTLDIAGLRMRVYHIPGHSPGHVVYELADESPGVVINGDVLFRGSIGRTDFPGGSFEQLKEHIERVLWPMPDATVVYTGHGPETTIGHERRTNPFVGRGY